MKIFRGGSRLVAFGRRQCRAQTPGNSLREFSSSSMQHGRFRTEVIPIFEDNYSYIVVDGETSTALAIDTADIVALQSALDASGAELRALISTHWHDDHTRDNIKIAQRFPGVEIFGPSDEDIPARTRGLRGGEIFQVDELRIHCISTPCHTSAHLSFYMPDLGASGSVFTGDCLFFAGCGRFFEGTASQMLQSLDSLAALPAETQVFPGHEYTLSNLKFAESVDPENKEISDFRRDVTKALEMGTIPFSTVGREKLVNPFMRVREQSIRQAVTQRTSQEQGAEVKEEDDEETMRLLRAMKDNF